MTAERFVLKVRQLRYVRRPKKCVYSRVAWEGGKLLKLEELEQRGGTGLAIKDWVAHWDSGQPVILWRQAKIKEVDHTQEFRHLGFTASLSGVESVKLAELKATARDVSRLI